MKTWLGTIVLSCLPAVGVAQTSAPAPTLKLDEAISTALADNRQLRASSMDVAKAAEAIAGTRSLRFPRLSANVLSGVALSSIDFTIPRGTLGVFPATGPIPAADASIETPRQFAGIFLGSVAQPLTQLYKIGLAVRESEVGEQLTREHLQQQRQDLVRQVRQAYAQLAQVRSQMDSAEEAVKYLTELSALTDRRLAEQTVLRSDSLAVKAKLSQQRYQLQTLRDNFDSGREAFNRLLGREPEHDFAVELQPLPAAEELSLDAAQSRALERRPELRQTKLQVTKAELDIRRENAGYLPDVSLQLSYLSFANINLLPAGIAHVGITAQWEPFDWGQRKHRVAELRLTAKQAQIATDDAESQIRVEVRASYRRLLEARALLDVQALAQETDREKLRVLMNRYEQNSALLADLLQAQSAVAQTDAQFQDAVAGFWNAKASFDRALGENY